MGILACPCGPANSTWMPRMKDTKSNFYKSNHDAKEKIFAMNELPMKTRQLLWLFFSHLESLENRLRKKGKDYFWHRICDLIEETGLSKPTIIKFRDLLIEKDMLQYWESKIRHPTIKQPVGHWRLLG